MMHAPAPILTGVQYPFTVYGIPMALGGAALGVAAGVYSFFVILRIPALSMVSGLIVLGVGIAWAVRAGRKDRHCETVMPRARRFWRGKKRRVLVSGRVSGRPQ